MGAHRRWTAVVLADPLIKVRTHGQIYERRIEKITDDALRLKVGRAVARRYGAKPPKSAAEDTTWYFHIAPR